MVGLISPRDQRRLRLAVVTEWWNDTNTRSNLKLNERNLSLSRFTRLE